MAIKSKLRMGQLNQAIDADVTFTGDSSRQFLKMDKDGNIILGDSANGAGVQIDGNVSGSNIVVESDDLTQGANDTDNKLITAAAVRNYVDAQVTAQDLDLAGDSGTGAVDLDSQSLTIAGGTGLASVAANQTVTLNLANTTVTAGSQGSATNVSTFTVDAQGRLTASGNVAISIPHGQVNDFDAGVQSNRLDQMAAPNAAVSMNSQRLTNVATPTNANDAVNKSFVDNLLSGLDTKASVKVATTTDLITSGGSKAYTYTHNNGTGNVGTILKDATGPVTIDGQSLAINDRILVKNQSQTRSNGIYEVTTVGTDGKSAMKIRVLGNHHNISNNSTFVFDVDDNGSGGAETYTITFKTSGSSSTSFTSRAADIRINDISNDAETIAGRIRTLFAANPFGASASWDAPTAVAADDGGFSFEIKAASANQNAFNFANVTGNVSGEIFGSKTDASAAAALLLTRAPDADGSAGVGAKLSGGSFVFVEQGSDNADAGFVVTSDTEVPFQCNQDFDGPTWTQFTGAGSLTKGDGIGGTGNNIQVNVDNSGIEINADTLRLKDNGVTLAKLATFAGRGRLIVSDSNNDPSELAAGSADQILRVDGAGDLGYQDITGVLRPKIKYFTTNNLQIGGGSNNTTTQINQVGASADLQAGSGPAYNNVMNSDGISAVFLNGMRLIGTGSDSTAIGSNFDYRFVAQGGKVRIEFAADLIAVGDVVQVVLLS